ncbi:hypothetical protein COLO4_29965 [Corchorus olitorius]|uniref:Uncharacterized protein n=1 Tax=Corchorus olitorius TaxID=93759 RepID=A0A1R3HC55_9ROSI|nr:hypothetical protein COLO4_29965 [Corchorus olitorius]
MAQQQVNLQFESVRDRKYVTLPAHAFTRDATNDTCGEE